MRRSCGTRPARYCGCSMQPEDPNTIEALLSRRSVPALQLREPGPSAQQIDAAIDAALCAPDHGGLKPWRFVLIRGAARERLSELFVRRLQQREPATPPGKLDKARTMPLTAPLIIAVGSRLRQDHKVPGVEQLLTPGITLRLQTHSLAALFTFCLPVGLASYWLTLLLIRPAVLEVVPDGAYLRLRAAHPPASIRQFSAWLYAGAALLLGAVTHLIWDAFTHENARGVRMFPLLTDYGPEMAGHPLHLYRWLQYGSSLVGLAVVAGALILWLRHAPAPAEAPRRRIGLHERVVWLGAYVLPSLLIMAWGFTRPGGRGSSPFTNGEVLGAILIRGLQYLAASLLLVSAAIRARLAL